MLVKDCMTRVVKVIGPDMQLQAAGELMQSLNVGALPICDGDRLVGMVTDRDITIRGVGQGYHSDKTPVSEVMTPQVIYCFEDQDIKDAADLMADHQIRRLVVLNRQKRLVGIISLGDVAVDTRNSSLSGKVLEAVSEPVHESSGTLETKTSGSERETFPSRQPGKRGKRG